MKAQAFLLKAFGGEYVACEGAIVLISVDYVREYKNLYVPAYNALKAKDNGFMYLVTTDPCVGFLEGIPPEISDREELDEFNEGTSDRVAIPQDIYNALVREPTRLIRGYTYAYIDDEGVHWAINEKHTDVTIESNKVSFELMKQHLGEV